MKLHKNLLLFIFLATGCSNVDAVNTENPEATANFIQKELYPDKEINYHKVDLSDGIEDVYDIGEDIRIIMTDDENIEQISFFSLSKDEVPEILELVDFPYVDSIEYFLDENEDYNATGFEPIFNDYFTKYEGVGLSLTAKIEDLRQDPQKPFSMILIYDPDRLESFEERNAEE